MTQKIKYFPNLMTLGYRLRVKLSRTTPAGALYQFYANPLLMVQGTVNGVLEHKAAMQTLPEICMFRQKMRILG